ncbi:hypothetical protein Godav_014615, partial [Gossypium davidsonii]|nr:hypothetical protein [Gossypium davidsonii]
LFTQTKEEQYWREAKGTKSKAAARRAEVRRQADMEEEEINKAMKKPYKTANSVAVPVTKVTEAELRKRRE